MRYTLFACDEMGGHQMHSDSNLELLKRAADDLRTAAINNGDDIRYVVKNGYSVVYKGKLVQER